MTDEDERAVAQLRAVFGERVVPKPVEPTADDGVVVDNSREIDEEFTRRLLEPSERKWRARQEWRDMDDRRQEGQSRRTR